MQTHGWVLLLAQLPASPSSPRVTLWRRARAAGAVGLQNGAWVLPGTEENREFFDGLAGYVREHGGTAYALTATAGAAAGSSGDDEIVARFRAERSKEFTEFAERGAALLAELEKESARDNFSFAELEENEQGLERLTGWLARISARDFFPDEHLKDAEDLLERCRRALDGFTAGVYRAEGVAPDVPPRDE
ncbi:Chromate resistance protein ChrB [Pseudonocardia nematodicida]|uniref:Chromate resistance protein ChrB n=1 Tax=Pseudonocardia nematodicida TaxID=1206997 RepID=A0ABV1KC84_9PSEU